MHSFVNRFSATSYAAELQKGMKELGGGEDDGSGSNALWGSQAGFGTLAGGVQTFNVPAVSDVRVSLLVSRKYSALIMSPLAFSLFEASYRRSRRPLLQDQN